ncbi:MAG: glycosyltransferase [Opitutales bacterium]
MPAPPVIICLGVFPSTGGTTRTVSAFQAALDAPVFSFVRSSELASEPLGVPGAEPVVAIQLPGLEALGVASGHATSAAEAAIRQAPLVSCHSYFRWHCRWVWRVCRRYGVPYWNVPHGILDPWVWSRGRLVKQVFHWLWGRAFLRDAACMIFASERERQKAQAITGTTQAEVLPWPVEPQTVSQTHPIRQAARARWSIPANARVVLALGRLHPMKRPLEIIRAVARTADANTYLLVAGPEDGVTLAEAEAVAAEEGFSDRCRVLGPVHGAEKDAVLAVADIYVSFSHRENFNHSAMECLSAGLPVVLSPGNDLAEPIIAAQAGWGLTADDEASLRQSLALAMRSSPERLTQMGHLGQAFVRQHASPERFSCRLQALVQQYGNTASTYA